MTRSLWVLGVVACACSGPEASDAELCRDIIHRLCAAPRCPDVDTAFAAGDACETTLAKRSGCDQDSFKYQGADKDRVLSCRLPLIRQGDGVEAPPSCVDVAETFDRCPDLVKALGGTP